MIIASKQNEEVLYHLSKATFQYNTVFSAHSVKSSIEELSNAMEFVLRGWRGDVAQCIRKYVSILRASPTVELVVN